MCVLAIFMTLEKCLDLPLSFSMGCLFFSVGLSEGCFICKFFFPQIIRLSFLLYSWFYLLFNFFLRLIRSHLFSFLFSSTLGMCACSIAKLCLTICDLTDCSLPGSSVHGILQARILEWVTISSSRTSSQPRYQPCISCIYRWSVYGLSCHAYV